MMHNHHDHLRSASETVRVIEITNDMLEGLAFHITFRQSSDLFPFIHINNLRSFLSHSVYFFVVLMEHTYKE